MHQVGDQEVGIELLRSWQKSVSGRCPRRIGQQRVGLQNHPQGKLRRELPVPLAAQNVVVEDPVAGSDRPQPLEKISILDLQRFHRTECKRPGRRILSRQKRSNVRGRNKFHPVSPVIPGPYRHLRKVAGLDGSSTAVFVIVLVMGESEKILRPQPLPQLLIREEIDKRLPPPLNRQIWRVVGVKPGSLVVENVTLVQGWSPIQDPALLRAVTVIYRLISS